VVTRTRAVIKEKLAKAETQTKELMQEKLVKAGTLGKVVRKDEIKIFLI
jgi:hypothetical protein